MDIRKPFTKAKNWVVRKLLNTNVGTKSLGVLSSGLNRLFGSSWSNTKFLKAYEKSLYVNACVSKISGKTAGVPINLFRINNSDGEVEQVRNHRVLQLIDRPNPDQSKSQFFKITLINKKLAGNAYIYKVRNSRGEVVELWNIRPDKITLDYNEEGRVRNYLLRRPDGTKTKIEPDDIIHIAEPSPLETHLGVSVLSAAGIRVDTEQYASKYQRDFFLNNARPDGLIISKSDFNLAPDQKEELRDNWEDRHKGIGKNSKVGVLEGNLEYQQISMSQREMDFIESMRFTRDDILVAFQVPKPIVAITDDVNRANAREAMAIFLKETIKPEIEDLVENLNDALVIPDFDERLFLDYEDPTPVDVKQKLEEHESGIQNYYKALNEIRAEENLPPVEGGWFIYMPINKAPLGEVEREEGKQLMAIGEVEKDYREKLTNKVRIARNKDKFNRFRGKYFTQLRLETKEVAKKGIEKTMKDKNKKVASKKGEKGKTKQGDPKPIFKGEEAKKKFYDLVNKQIDRRAENFKNKVVDIANGQKARVLARLREQNKDISVDEIDNVLNTNQENEILQSFVIPYLQDFLEEAGQEMTDIITPGEEFDVTPDIRRTLEERAEFFAKTVNETTFNKLKDTLSEAISEGEGIRDMSERVSNVYGEFNSYRAERIARTETTVANNEGFLEGMKQSEVATHKEWIATLDDRTRPEHQALNGEIVETDEDFSNGLPYPQEVNCRCVIAPAFEE